MNRLQKIAVGFFPVLLYSCITPDAPEPVTQPTTPVESRQSRVSTDSLVIDTQPRENKFVIAALSPRLRTETDERQYAMANAARQLSIYKHVEVLYGKVLDENGTGTVQDQKIEVLYDRDYALSLLNSLKIESEVRNSDHYAALITMKGKAPSPFPLLPVTPGQKPEWTTKTPDSKDYIYGVGMSARLKTPYDSWEQSDKQAMAEIANFLGTDVGALSASIERAGKSFHASTSAGKSFNWSDAIIEGLYIISRWREPDGSSYYSLAVVKKP